MIYLYDLKLQEKSKLFNYHKNKQPQKKYYFQVLYLLLMVNVDFNLSVRADVSLILH